VTDGQRQPNYLYLLTWLRSHETKVLTLYRGEFEITDNPLWVWEALSYVTEIRDCAMKVGENSTDLVVPDWCADYLKKVSGNLTRLASGMPLVDRQAEGRIDTVDDRISSAQAQALVPSALGLTRRGTSAFAQQRNAIEDELLFYRFEDLRRIGLSYEQSIADLQTMRPTTDTSALAKRITAGKRRVERRRQSLPPYKSPITGER
jgi:hypothetical protein